MSGATYKSPTLIRFSQISNDILDSRRLLHLKNIVFILVLLNCWGKFYNKVLVGGPVRAYYDLKAHVMKVCITSRLIQLTK